MYVVGHLIDDPNISLEFVHNTYCEGIENGTLLYFGLILLEFT